MYIFLVPITCIKYQVKKTKSMVQKLEHLKNYDYLVLLPTCIVSNIYFLLQEKYAKKPCFINYSFTNTQTNTCCHGNRFLQYKYNQISFERRKMKQKSSNASAVTL